jgi:RNA polymerase sigma-70 factor (ECF subfamily)
MTVMDDHQRRDAVERAYRDHADDVYRVAYAILRDPDAAMDATQEAFARAFQRWHQYDTARSLRAWLHGIGAHAALDALRRRRIRDLLSAGSIAEIDVRDPRATGDPGAALASRQLMEDLLASLRPLPRAALVLRHVYGYEYTQIAEFLGTSPGNVGSMLTRSHATLRQRLASAEPAAVAWAEDVRASR